ncbi:sugar ABC transporter permease [Alicyclobacillus fastidiosus]|uniref:Sugar ABC transporter permease n=1 Tax=Alicyclobacillus fastidiosus TaxID=392011 RepID=A0ABY6ZMT9_9BACL|nr:sugar ABC transporter permease [Alicyclobacillus fastidiosus]WAH44157.1 sugar ABC transporter permease [Alicyclobacillus fastidiosus]GMA60464.1 sugar ABC transporter permease [Alicyclobacillus fastidiosus]
MITQVTKEPVITKVKKPRPKRGLSERQEERMFWVFISPWVIGFLAFSGGPIIASLFLSFTKYNVMSAPVFVGLKNFIDLFQDPIFYKSLGVTLYYTVLSVPFDIVLALLLAVLLNQKVKGQAFFRTIFYAPSIVSGVAISFLWSWLLNPVFGVVNYLLSFLGIHGILWFSGIRTVVPSFVLMTMTSIGGTMIIFLASLQSLPTDVYEAAALDGASKFQQFIKITVPLISPVILFNVIIGIINSFQVFTQAYVITQGGPNYNSYFYVYYLFDTAFNQFRMGYASAQAWILFIIVALLTFLSLHVSKKYVYYGDSAHGGN